MFESIGKFLAELSGADAPARHFDENDYRLAAAALLVHAAAIDGEMSPVERDKLQSLLKRSFELDESTAGELVTEATEAEHQAVDLYHFTSLLNRTLNDAGRRRIIEMMWEVVYADGQRTEIEDNLIWRAADLLGLSGRERIELRQRVEEQRGNQGEDA